MKLIYSIFFGLILLNSKPVQGQWTWEEKQPLPEAVSNNAVTGAVVDGNKFVYSFAGIDSTKIFSGIHKRCYKYDVLNDSWTQLPDLPTGNGRIAAGASLLKNKIYIVGGYEVFENGVERSFREVHVFDPEIDSFIADARSLFFPIDDHIQGVWRDSLLYVITGWSNTANLIRVQVYNPETDSWKEATPVPDESRYKVFGGSGVIIGDTIYYAGGATDQGQFPPTAYFRKGAINPSNPCQIKWTGWQTPFAKGYRMASSSLNGNPIWFGGSQNTYNYDGIAYDNSGGVSPNGNILMYKTDQNDFELLIDTFPATMDFRGIGAFPEGQYFLVGGMVGDQMVSDQVLEINYLSNSSTKLQEDLDSEVEVFPNPFKNSFKIKSNSEILSFTIYDVRGMQLEYIQGEYLESWNWGEGVFIIDIELKNGDNIVGKIINQIR